MQFPIYASELGREGLRLRKVNTGLDLTGTQPVYTAYVIHTVQLEKLEKMEMSLIFNDFNIS